MYINFSLKSSSKTMIMFAEEKHEHSNEYVPDENIFHDESNGILNVENNNI